MNRVPAIKQRLHDPMVVLGGLGMLVGARRQAHGFVVRCPVHGDNTPSCSVQSRRGSIVWHCFGCDASGDVLDLIGAAKGLNLRTDFRELLNVAEELCGSAVPGTKTYHTNHSNDDVRVPPDLKEVLRLWDQCVAVTADTAVSAWVESRGLRGIDMDARRLLQALPMSAILPRWARCQRMPWTMAGFRAITPMFDEYGVLRSVRARRVTEGSPKSTAPAGHTCRGLVMADELARCMLSAGTAPNWWPSREPFRLVIAEGEPDYLTWAVRVHEPRRWPPTAVIGIEAGSWSDAVASRVPDGSKVAIWSHHDRAGDGYAHRIMETLGRRCRVSRGGQGS